MRVALFKMGEAGSVGVSMNPEAILLTMRDNWELLCNKKACAAYLAERDLAAKRKSRAEALSRAKVLAAEIEALGGDS